MGVNVEYLDGLTQLLIFIFLTFKAWGKIASCKLLTTLLVFHRVAVSLDIYDLQIRSSIIGPYSSLPNVVPAVLLSMCPHFAGYMLTLSIT